MSYQQAIYERTMAGSFMKLKSGEENLDERILLKQKIPGLIGVEKTYYDEDAWYLYHISGKQSLETLCQAQPIRVDFLEKFLIGLCSEVEILERNLLSVDKLMLEPAFVFITNQNQEVIFSLYPLEEGVFREKLVRLMEYMLSKLDHKDAIVVALAYKLYEMAQEEECELKDLRDYLHNHVMEAETTQVKEPATPLPPQELYEPKLEEGQMEGEEITEGHLQEIFALLKDKCSKLRQTIVQKTKASKSKEEQEIPLAIAYPEDYEKEQPKQVIHPTICLSDYREHPDGLLLYEGYDNFSDYQIKEAETHIGQGEDALLKIPKETVSHFHACIHKREDDYYLEDMNSTNGTYVNDEILSYKEERRLKSNDIIRFADVKYRFV